MMMTMIIIIIIIIIMIMMMTMTILLLMTLLFGVQWLRHIGWQEEEGGCMSCYSCQRGGSANCCCNYSGAGVRACLGRCPSSCRDPGLQWMPASH